MSWLSLAILLCLAALVGLLTFMGLPGLLLHPPIPESYPPPTPVVSRRALPSASPQPRISEWATIDEYALAAPPDQEKDVATLARYLRGATRNDREKIRAIYRWVCDRIAYDGAAYRDHRFPDTSGNFTLKRKKAICGGYARLVYELGQAAGLQIELVHGDSRGGVLSRAGKTEKHAWNAVCLDSEWYLVDATWGAGTLDDDFSYEKDFQETYFLIAPDQLRFSHFPEEPRWQLSRRPLSKAQFLNQAVLTPAFFQLGLSWKRQPPLRLRDPQRLDLNMKEKLDIQAGLLPLDGEELEGATLVNYGAHSAQIHIAPPKPGRYRLALLGARWDEDASVSIAEFEVIARRGRPDGFPEQDAAFVKRHANLFAPLSGRLRPGSHHFRLQVPEARTVTCGGNPLTQNGDIFEGNVTAHNGYLTVRAQFDGEEMETLLTYRVKP